jgi:ATP-dependent protease ClpP protease subunit
MRRPQLVQIPDRGLHRIRAFQGAFALEQGAVPTINLYDSIGEGGVTARDVRRMLDTITAPTLRVRIDSPGGDVFDGLAIYNDLVACAARVEVEIVGLAASAASVVAMAADRIEIAASAFVMVHRAWSFALGNAGDLRHTAGVLDQVDTVLAEIYADATGQQLKKIIDWMSAETWLDGQAAVDAGFADALIDIDPPARAFALDAYARVPAQVKRRSERALHESGLSRSQARRGVPAPEPVPVDDADLAAALEALAERLEHG